MCHLPVTLHISHTVEMQINPRTGIKANHDLPITYGQPTAYDLKTTRDLPVWRHLNELYERHLSDRGGTLASYIPELATVESDRFGIAFATTDGFVYEVGDAAAQFTIQSISKPIVYGLALQDHGQEEMLRRIGVEPSGDAFNSINFDEQHNRPFNPMINSGAIAICASIIGSGHQERYARILDMFRRFTGRSLAIDEAVYRSEARTGNRNRAIAYLELNAGMIGGDVDEHLDLYFRQCSLLVTPRDLAVIGATLANGGLNPVTGERALDAEYVRSVLSVMNSCGMYDYAGGWQFDIGLPAKSGVGGGITAVVPGHLGIGVFSPRVDAVGNSVRGVKVCEDISRYFRLHLFEERGSSLVPFRRIYRGGEIRSKRIRRRDDARRLDRQGHLIVVYELQAELSFIEAERVTRRIIGDQETATHFILDLTRVVRIDAIALELLNTARETLEAAGKTFAIVTVSSEVPSAFAQDMHFPDADIALEFFEDRLLDMPESSMTASSLTEIAGDAVALPLEQFDLLSSMSDSAVAALRALLQLRPFAAGEKLIAQNSEAAELFFLTRGRVDVAVPVRSGLSHRVSTIDAGNMFGELALFGRAQRTADVIPATDGEALVLSADGMARLRDEHAEAYTGLLLAVGSSLTDRLRRANAEIRALSK